MSTNALVIGSGLGAYGSVLALLKSKKDIIIDVMDIGLTSPYKDQPNKIIPNAKDVEGNYYPYGLNDKRWKINIQSERLCSSHAFGGFSKVYSGSILQPQFGDLSKWPKESIPNDEDYENIISSLKIKHKIDELEDEFPLYPKNKQSMMNEKIVLGSSRIAYNKKLGDDYPFDVSVSFQEWVNKGFINYKNNHFVMKLEKNGRKIMTTVDTVEGIKYFEYDFVYVAAGCINTTALIDRSIYLKGTRTYEIKEASILMQLCLKLDPKRLLRKRKQTVKSKYTLCEYFLEVRSKKLSNHWSHTQIGSLNKIILEKAKQKLPYLVYFFLSKIHKLFNFSQTFLHSDIAPVKIILISKLKNNNIKSQEVFIKEKRYLIKSEISTIIKLSILSKFKKLKLIPLPFSQTIGAFFRGNKLGGWHVGGTLPMMFNSEEKSHCKASGELNGIENVFIVDSSSFPTIPGSSVALLTMANSYRITRKSLLKISN